MRTDQTQLQQTLRALQKAFSHQLAFAESPELKSAVTDKIALVDDWIVRAEKPSSITPLARELKTGIGKALDVYVAESPLNDAIDKATEKVWTVASDILAKPHKVTSATPITTVRHFRAAKAKRAASASPLKKAARKPALRARAKRKR